MDDAGGELAQVTAASATALECDFPGGVYSRLAQRESWRKEVQRPASHTHKWWAQRLGTVFRGLIASAMTESAADALRVYRGELDLGGRVVFDPFAGSGTSLVEAAKLGAGAVGIDLNPVATLVQRQALTRWDQDQLNELYAQVEDRCRAEIDALHVAEDGRPVLYYFWVAQCPCPICDESVDLFSTRIVARSHAPGRRRWGRAICPQCGSLPEVDATADTARCGSCLGDFSTAGAVRGAHMTCSTGHRHRIVDALGGTPPRHRLYATLVLDDQGRRSYRPATSFDRALAVEAERRLEARRGELLFPTGELVDGQNTRQVMRWGYLQWDQLFNARQLYSLGLLGAAVRDLPEGPEREALATLFSGTLEFNNLMCSYKGEGTGAVRHAFAHHVLRPERAPLEAHPWGTPASSGSFSTLFRTRLLRAHDYKRDPHDLVPGRGQHGGRPTRVSGISQPAPGLSDLTEVLERGRGVAVICGNGARSSLPDRSADLVLTDPPFMDNVHYSELADFFHAWLRGLRPWSGYPYESPSTRVPTEVQSSDPAAFEAALTTVWIECARVLAPAGLMVFTFHQARLSGWMAMVRALRAAGLAVTAVQPVKAEMSTSVVKASTEAPSNLDSVLVCRRASDPLPVVPTTAAQTAAAVAGRLERLVEAGITAGPTDVVSVVRGAVLSLYTLPTVKDDRLDELAAEADRLTGPIVERIAALRIRPAP